MLPDHCTIVDGNSVLGLIPIVFLGYCMDMITSLLLFLLCIGVGIVIYLLMSGRGKDEDRVMLEWLKTTQRDLRNLQQTLSETSSRNTRELSESMRLQTQDIHERLTRASEVIGELKREAGAFSEVSRSMKELHEFLKSPKLRGNIGEQVLNDLIGQMFPKNSFFIQHHFKTGSIVDVALKTDAGILPIDSKFPMEQFQEMMKGETKESRDGARKEFGKIVKKHIDAIASKYILPEEGTMDFALMYVPSESVYYEIAADTSLFEYARKMRVYPVSPTTLYAHLQTILLSFEGKKVEQRSKYIFAQLRSIEQSFKQFESNFQVLGKHITNAHNAYSSSVTTLSALDRNVQSARMLKDESTTLLEDSV